MRNTTAYLLNAHFASITGRIFYGCNQVIGISKVNQTNFLLWLEGGVKVTVGLNQKILVEN